MGREIVYCEGCGISLRTDDFEKGRAHEVNNRPWCVACKPLPNPPAVKKSSTSRIPALRPDSPRGAGYAPVRTGTSRRSGPGGPSPALIGGIVAGIALLLVLVVLALSGGRSAPRHAPPPAPEPPPPPRPSSAQPAPRPAVPPAIAREEEVVPKTDPAQRVEQYLAQLRELVAKDTRFLRRRDALGQIEATLAVAGARADEVRKIRADYDKAFDEAAAKSAAGIRAEMEKLAAAGDAVAAAAKIDELPAPFAETRHAQELRAAADGILRKAEESAKAVRAAKEAALKEWKPVGTGGEVHYGVKDEHRGRSPVLETHPVSREQPLGLERELQLPAGRRAVLRFFVAPHAQGDWELRVLVDGKERLKQEITPPGSDWREVKVDLSGEGGRRVKLRLDHAATGWSWEHGYWADFELRIE